MKKRFTKQMALLLAAFLAVETMATPEIQASYPAQSSIGTVVSDDRETMAESDADGQSSAEDLADLVGTISYEVLTNLSARVPRVYLHA